MQLTNKKKKKRLALKVPKKKPSRDRETYKNSGKTNKNASIKSISSLVAHSSCLSVPHKQREIDLNLEVAEFLSHEWGC